MFYLSILYIPQVICHVHYSTSTGIYVPCASHRDLCTMYITVYSPCIYVPCTLLYIPQPSTYHVHYSISTGICTLCIPQVSVYHVHYRTSTCIYVPCTLLYIPQPSMYHVHYCTSHRYLCTMYITVNPTGIYVPCTFHRYHVRQPGKSLPACTCFSNSD